MIPGVEGIPRTSWHRRAYSSAGSNPVLVWRAWSTLAKTTCLKLNRPAAKSQKRKYICNRLELTSQREILFCVTAKLLHCGFIKRVFIFTVFLALSVWCSTEGQTSVGEARLDQFVQEVFRDALVSLVVFGHSLQRLLLPNPVLQHLGWSLHKVPFHVGPTEHGVVSL